MAVIKQFDFRLQADKIKQHPHGRNWPVVYILETTEGKPEIYIGETNSAHRRSQQHSEDPRKTKLRRMHVITDYDFNKSATLEIESSLIKYMSADGLYMLQNSNAGIVDSNYYDREKYQAKFKNIWRELQNKGLARGELEDIENSNLFKYSPYKALTIDQKEIIEEIADDILENAHSSHLVTGGVGTGKTIMATYLVKYLLSKAEEKSFTPPKIGLVVPMESLRTSIKQVFRQASNLSPNMVISPHYVSKHKYDILIVDEAHRLKRRVNLSQYGLYDRMNKELGLQSNQTQLDWLFKCSKYQVLFYDPSQSVQPADIRPEEFKSKLFKQLTITSQMRVAGGNQYIRYIEDILSDRNPKKQVFQSYEAKLFDDINEMVATIKSKNSQFGLSRVLAGYAWDWQTKNNPEIGWDIEINSTRLKWNSTNKNWVNSKNALNEVGCIHTIQGYDLNYAGVIIGADLQYNTHTKRIVVNKDNYKDRNGKRSLDNDYELEAYIRNIYKVLLTRGVKGTFIYAVDESLRNHLKQYF